MLLAVSWRQSVCPSVCLSTCNVAYYGAVVRCIELNVVTSCTLLAAHFLFTALDTFAFCGGCYGYHGPKRKATWRYTESSRCTAHAIEYNPSTATWFHCPRYEKAQSQAFNSDCNKVEGRRARGRQRLKFLGSYSTCWEDKVSPTQIIRAAEDWDCSGIKMVANVVNV